MHTQYQHCTAERGRVDVGQFPVVRPIVYIFLSTMFSSIVSPSWPDNTRTMRVYCCLTGKLFISMIFPVNANKREEYGIKISLYY